MWPNDVLSDPLWQRLAMALLHFLWQGTLVAALYSVAIQWFGARPERRYLIGVVALAVLAACPTITYCLVEPPYEGATAYRPDQAGNVFAVQGTDTKLLSFDSTSTADLHLLGADSLSSQYEPDVTKQYSTESLATSLQPPAWRQELHRWIIAVWLVGVIVLAARLVAGALGLRLLSRRTSIADSEYLRMVERLSRVMEFRRIPRLVVSRRVRQAIATGFFRPLIILPAAWLSELPPAVIEAVVAHELAHIRRHDLWVNLLQRVLEALLFFHPAVWWISRQLRGDREMCCDELAVAATRQKLEYVSALELVARRAAREPVFSLATGIGGQKMQLLERVRHVLGLPVAPRPRAWWPAGLLALAVPCGLWLMSGVATPPAYAQEEDRASREREEREDRERDERDAAREREERDEARRERDREREERDEEDRDRDVREREEEEREVGDRPRRRETRGREPGDRPRRDREQFEERLRIREGEAARQRDIARAREEVARARRRSEQARDVQQREAQRAMEAAREQMHQAVAQAQKQLAGEIQRAQENGQQDKLRALEQQLQQVQQQAQEQARAFEQKIAEMNRAFQRKAEPDRGPDEVHLRALMAKIEQDLTARGEKLSARAADAEKAGDKALLEKIHAEGAKFKADAAAQREKIKRALSDKLGDKVTAKIQKDPLANKLEYKYTGKQPEGSPEVQHEMMRMIKELRGEVQQLRREVRELREQGGRAEKKPRGKQAVSFEFNDENEEHVVKPEVRLEFSEEKLDEPSVELEFLQEEIDKLENEPADDAKALELNIELADEKLSELKGVELEFTNNKLDKLNAKIDKDLKVEPTIKLDKNLKDEVKKDTKGNKEAVEKTLKATIELKSDVPDKKEIKTIELKSPTIVLDKIEKTTKDKLPDDEDVTDKVKLDDKEKLKDEKPADKPKP